MGRTRVNLVLACAALLLASPLFAGTSKGQRSTQAANTMGISVTMPDGSSETVPVQSKVSSIIPTPGAKGVFGVQLEPYMSGQMVSVRVRAVLGDSWTDAKGPSFQTARNSDTKALGSYVIGATGDSIQLADLAQFGLPAITLKVVTSNLATKTCANGGDPCLLCDNGIVCCWTTLPQKLACIDACNAGLRKARRKK